MYTVSEIRKIIKEINKINAYGTSGIKTLYTQLSSVRNPKAVKLLLNILKSKNNKNNIKAAAVTALGNIGSKKAFLPLIDALSHPNEFVRQKTIIALGLLNDTRAIKPLLESSSLTYSKLQSSIHEVILGFDYPELLDDLSIYLKELKAYPQESITNLIAKINNSQSTAMLIGLLEHKSTRIVGIAIDALGEREVIQAVKPISKIYYKLNTLNISKAIDAFSKIKDPECIQVLVKTLNSSFSGTRSKKIQKLTGPLPIKAAYALGEVGGPIAVYHLLKTLNKRKKLSAQVILSLGKIKDSSTVIPLMKLLIKEDDNTIKKTIIWALGEIKDAKATKNLCLYLKSNDDDIVFEALKSLKKISDKNAIDSLTSQLGHENGKIRNEIAATLGMLGETKWINVIDGSISDYYRMVELYKSKSLDILINAMKSKDADTRILIAQLLGGYDNIKALNALINGLNDVPEVKIQIINSLGKSKKSIVLQPLHETLADENSGVRVSAASALYNIGEIEWVDVINGSIDDFANIGKSKLPEAENVLLNAIKSSNATLRTQACIGLSEFKSTQVKLAIVELIENDIDKDVQIVAAKALANVKFLNQKIIKTIIDIYVKSNTALRKELSVTIKNSNDTIIITYLMSMLGHNNGRVRKEIEEILHFLEYTDFSELINGSTKDFVRLGHSKNSDAVYPLMYALEFGTNEIKEVAADALGSAKDTRTVELLITRLDVEENVSVRRKIAAATTFIDDINNKYVKILIKALGDSDKDTNESIKVTIKRIKYSPIAHMLLDTAIDKSNSNTNRISAIELLGDIRLDKVVDPLIKMLDIEQNNICVAIIKTIGVYQHPLVMELLLKRLDEGSSDMQIAAAFALGKHGDYHAIEPLKKKLFSQDKMLRKALGIALKDLGKRVLGSAVKGDDEDFNQLSAVNDPVFTSILLDSLDSESWKIREIAATALGYSSNKNAIEPLIELLYLPDNSCRRDGSVTSGKVRKAAALSLILLSRTFRNDDIITPQIRKIMTKAHEDTHNSNHVDNRPSTSDCTSGHYTNERRHEHIDTGVGIKARNFRIDKLN